MIGSKRIASAGIVVLVVISACVLGPGAVAGQEGTSSATTTTSGGSTNNSSGQTIAVRQVESGTPTKCIPVQALGDGTQSVEEFYGFEGSPDMSSVGAQDLQYSDTSQVMFYNGSTGLSVVVMHDKYGDRTPGGDANMTFRGLPNGTWPVQDDDEDADFSADDWYIYDHSAIVQWEWGTSRTDGAVFRTGADFQNASIVPEFNDSDENIEAWGLRSAGRDSLIRLDMDRNLSFSTGDCPAQNDADGEETAEPTPTISLGPGENVDEDSEAESTGTTGVNGSNNTSANVVASGPQAFVVTNLTADRSTVAAGEPINITATVENEADETLARNVVFRTSENSTTERALQLGPGEQQYVQFSHTYDEPGSYSLRAGAATLDVTVTSAETGPGFGVLPGIMALVVVVLSVVARRRTGSGENGGDSGEE